MVVSARLGSDDHMVPTVNMTTDSESGMEKELAKSKADAGVAANKADVEDDSAAPIDLVMCIACNHSLSKPQFSRSQLKKASNGTPPRCYECVSKGDMQPPSETATNDTPSNSATLQSEASMPNSATLVSDDHFDTDSESGMEDEQAKGKAAAVVATNTADIEDDNAAPTHLVECKACKDSLPKTQFSKKQLKKRSSARCVDCVTKSEATNDNSNSTPLQPNVSVKYPSVNDKHDCESAKEKKHNRTKQAKKRCVTSKRRVACYLNLCPRLKGNAEV